MFEVTQSPTKDVVKNATCIEKHVLHIKEKHVGAQSFKKSFCPDLIQSILFKVDF